MPRPCQTAALLLLSGILPTGVASTPADGAAGTVHIDVNRSGRMHLEARGVTVAAVLDELAKKAEIPIRYSDTPDHAVTADCSGSTLKEMLLCLLGEKADLLFVGGQVPGKSRKRPEWQEVRVLASTFWKQARSSFPEQAGGQDDRSGTPVTSAAPSEGGDADLQRVLAMTRSPNPEDRALGLNRLVNSGIADPATLDAAIQAGLADADGEVRAEALSSSVRLRLQEGPSRIEQGLQDANASVRLAAVDSLKPDERGRQLLQERLADEDPAVRSLARMKLGILP